MTAIKFSTRKARDSLQQHYLGYESTLIVIENLVKIEITENATKYLYHFR